MIPLKKPYVRSHGIPMIKYPGILILFLFIFSSNAFTQQNTISGKVISSSSNEPLPGVNIIVKGTTNGAVTNLNGEYTISATPSDILVISFIGYDTEEIQVGDQTRINVSLEEDITQLEEVVVTGYGTMKKSDMTSAQIAVSAEQIERAQATTLDQALQGRAAGVYVAQNTGQPGGAVSVKIRGVNSINSTTEPLYIIDGVQIMGKTETSLNPLASINPDDIESLTVLQGPSATAIYGSRASNGVVVITTKTGKVGETKITYSGSIGISEIPKLIDVMNLQEYAQFANEQIEIRGGSYDPYFADPSVLGEGTNWQKELYQPAAVQKHQLQLSGGSENVNYFLSAGYYNEEGVALGSGFNRYTLRSNIEANPKDWLTIGTKISISQMNDILTFEGDDSGRLIYMAIMQSPAIPVRNLDGSWGGPATTQYAISNPVALASINTNEVTRRQAIGGLYALVDIVKGLKLTTEINGDINYKNQYKYEPGYQFGGYVKDQSTAKSYRYSNQNYYWNFLVRLNYNLVLGGHDIGIMAAHEAQESQYRNLDGTRTNFVTNTIEELNAGDATTATATSGLSEWAQESYFTRVNYMYAGKYIFQGTVRADGSPNFSKDYRWGVFPSLSVAWKISDEAFFSGIESINNLKLRGEWGITGNQNSGGPTYYASLNTIASQWGTGYLTSNYSNPNFQWEESNSYNVGFDMYLFNNRIEFIVDAYKKETDNLMMKLPLPAYMGTDGTNNGSITAPWTNIGAIGNKGIAFTINTKNTTGLVRWESGLTITVERNELTKVYKETQPLDRSPWFMTNFISRSEVGQPVWQFYGYEKYGVFETMEDLQNSAIPENNTIDEISGTWVGDNKYVDQPNSNGVADGVINASDRTFIGDPNPDFYGGFFNKVSYKNFDLVIDMNFSYGNDIFNYVRYVSENPEGDASGRNYLRTTANYAKIATNSNGEDYVVNSGTQIPRITVGDPNGNNLPTDQYVEDGSFLRIKNVQLSYNFPRSILEKVSIDNLRLAFAIKNLATLTNYSGSDPEIGQFIDQNTSSVIPGVDYGRYPSSRSYNISLVVGF